MRTVCGSEFQTDGVKNQKARLDKSVLMNGPAAEWQMTYTQLTTVVHTNRS